jgi:hypothetical protein
MVDKDPALGDSKCSISIVTGLKATWSGRYSYSHFLDQKADA